MTAFAFSSWPLVLSQEEPASTSRSTSNKHEMPAESIAKSGRESREGKGRGGRATPAPFALLEGTGATKGIHGEKTARGEGEPGEMQMWGKSGPRRDSSQGCGAGAGAAGMPGSLPKTVGAAGAERPWERAKAASAGSSLHSRGLHTRVHTRAGPGCGRGCWAHTHTEQQRFVKNIAIIS